jgi:hypothetical protein
MTDGKGPRPSKCDINFNKASIGMIIGGGAPASREPIWA